MPDTTYKQAAGLIRKAEKISNLPVRVTWDDTLQVGAVLHLSEAQWSKQLRISVNPNRPDIPYLVGVQCGLAIRFYTQREQRHLTASQTSRDKAVSEFRELGYAPEMAKSLAENLLAQLGSQIRSAAPLIKLSAQIFRDYPELRDSQLTHFLLEKEDGERSLGIDAAKFPEWILRSHQAINGANALAADYLFERTDFFAPFKQAGFEAICTGLVGDVTGSKADVSDTELVNAWLNRLDLNDRFEWMTP
ncbi:hypothetical protein IVG45_03450 [Methylomonas sp. LL1]|uniref:hypothetical protein n=1 Tax=Methylomonas sp. LL1 TaxID=2785785 RepID=UPI0018C3C387|nr:hypothetical protein [Methylomonas sp. LL1]QPK64047.1 hypothetical protein IVG45_03450 [Methylomonas sp. LL1]